MRILVTGAASPLGRVVVQQLVQHQHSVVGMARRLSGMKAVEKLGVEAVRGDVRRPDHIARAAMRCDAIVHLAGFFDFWEPVAGTYESVNVGAVNHVLATAIDGGVKRVVLCSSALTIGEVAGTMGEESTAHRGYTYTALERSKLQAERLALKARSRGLEVVIVNPALVVAPGDPGWLGRKIGATVAGRAPLAAHAPLGFVWVEDAARGIVRALESGDDGARYILCGETLSSHRFLSRVAASVGARSPRTLPSQLTFVEAAIRTAIAKPFKKRPGLAMDEARFLTTGFTVKGSFAHHELELEYTPSQRWLPALGRAYAKQGTRPAARGT